MLTLLLLLSSLSPALAWIVSNLFFLWLKCKIALIIYYICCLFLIYFQPVEDWESGNVTASEGESGQCVCHVYLPDTTFPADRVQQMQQVSKDLILEVEIQIKKVQ